MDSTVTIPALQQMKRDGKMQHAVLLELFTNTGTGTLIHK